ncbi:MAG: DUF2207 domain-containing protein [Aminobacterium colombiense]|jgi:uncharacterized membrane protein YgcG|nr:DUF2207 domain-containing protein [Aminobacterium colombiense]MDD4265864.1 DUF2207 domain-containing protein [Aminobacterium colombiense]
MKSFHRLFLLIFLFLIFLTNSAGAEEVILSFSSYATVKVDASLEVREDITVWAEGKQIQRGIYRDFPTIYRDTSGKIVRVGFFVKGALLNGKKVPYRTESRSNGVRIYLGDPNRRVPFGEQTYSLIYVTTGQVGFYEKHDELYWNVTGNDWGFPIRKVRFSISLPQKVSFSSVDIYTGYQGATGKDAQLLSDGSVQTTRSLAPREGLTVAYTWPKGIVTPPNPLLRYTFFDRYGIWFFIGAPLLLLAYYAAAWHRWGNDPPRKPVIPLFTPTKGIGPGFMRYVKRLGMDNACFTAEILNLAVRGFIVIEELTFEESVKRLGLLGNSDLMKKVVSFSSSLAGKRYSLKLNQEQLSRKKRSIEEDILISALFDEGRIELLLRQNNHKILSRARTKLLKYYRQAAKPLFSKNTLPWAAGFIIPAIIYLLLGWGGQAEMAVFSVAGTFIFSIVGSVILSVWNIWRERGQIMKKIFATLFPILFFAGIAQFFFLGLNKKSWYILIPILATVVMILLFRKLMTIRSEKGNDVLGEVDGLAMYMGTAERYRLEMFHPPQETPEIFERLLPYAFALDTADTWANRFDSILQESDYHPEWYTGTDISDLYTGRAMANMASSIASSIASASVAPGSKSGSGGRGFSGGGGGGGGGGGW